MTQSKKTPLYEFSQKHGARFIDFGGWEMPVQYTGIIEEHKVVREKVGLFDVSHMGEALVHGKDALSFLNTTMTNDVSVLKENESQYSIMCHDNGGCVDDLLIYKYAENEYLLCLNASNTEKDIAWLKNHLQSFDCKVDDVSQKYGQLALQGPLATKTLELLASGLEKLKRFHFIEQSIKGVETIISRTGYTGEDGYELYCAAEETEFLAETLMDAGKNHGIQLCGLGARDSLRLEAGYSLYGHEISQQITPLEAHLDFVVKLNKPSNFIGKAALKQQKNEGLKQEVKFFKLNDKRIARQGFKVYNQSKEVGEVLSGTYSPTLNMPIGSMLVTAELNDPLFIDIRGNRIPVLIVQPPFI